MTILIPTEMFDYVTQFSKEGKDELTIEERNILSVAFKNVVGTRRAAWRVISLIERKETKKGSITNAQKALHYKQIIEKELTNKCRKILSLIEVDLVKNAKTEEGKVFLYKMQGDYYRYIAEYSLDNEKNNAAKKAQDSYDQAQQLAISCLQSTHPMRLGLALNYSVFFYEIKQNASQACKMARDAFDEAIADLDDIDDDFYKDATLIMQLLRDNLTLWTEEVEAEQAPENQ